MNFTFRFTGAHRRSAAAAALFAVAALAACSGSTQPAEDCSTSTQVTCSQGQSVQACAQKNSDGLCAGASFKVGGQTFSCASCTDCTQAAMQAAQACTGGGSDGSTPADASLPDGFADGFGGGSLYCDQSPGGVHMCVGVTGADAAQQAQLEATCTSMGGMLVASCSPVNVGCCAFSSSGYKVQLCYDDCPPGGDVSVYQTLCMQMQNGTGVWMPGPVACVGVDSGPPDSGSMDAPTEAETGPVCGNPPTLHPEAMPGVFCPFTSAGMVTCAAGQECCEPQQASGAASTCQPDGTACPVAGSSQWECEDALDCSGNIASPICCATGSVVHSASCSYYVGNMISGTACSAACGSGQVIICTSNAQCPSGQTCTPFKTQGLDLGTCM